MPKVLNCGEIVPGCKARIEGEDEAEVMMKGAQHAREAHGMATIPPDVEDQVRAAIRDQ